MARDTQDRSQGIAGAAATAAAPRDFTMAAYHRLLDALQEAGYVFQTFSGFLRSPGSRVVMLRHDVDDRKLHSLEFARIQHDRGIVGSYFFRMVPRSFDADVIREVHAMGHEVGHHYEEMDVCKGDVEAAMVLFRRNLERLRGLVPVESICMHGSPLSAFDNKDLWKHYDYRDLGIIGEPYFDLDFGRVAYYTDTGRRWDGDAYSVRDRVQGGTWGSYHTTNEMIDALRDGTFPTQVMLNFHPQRWTDSPALWTKDMLVQQLKNKAKYGVIKWRAFKQARTS